MCVCVCVCVCVIGKGSIVQNRITEFDLLKFQNNPPPPPTKLSTCSPKQKLQKLEGRGKHLSTEKYIESHVVAVIDTACIYCIIYILD